MRFISIFSHLTLLITIILVGSLEVHAKAIYTVKSLGQHASRNLDLRNAEGLLDKRANPGCPPDPNQAVPSMLESWAQVACSPVATEKGNYVPMGGVFTFPLDVTQSKVMTTSEFYGCTVIIIPGTNQVLFGHWAQYRGNSPYCVLDNAAQTNTAIVDKLNLKLAESTFEEEAPIAIIAKDETVLNSAPGVKVIAEAIDDDGIRGIKYVSYPAGKGGMPDNSPTGKAVVQWIPKSNGGATMRIYVSSLNPVWTGEFGTDGVYCG